MLAAPATRRPPSISHAWPVSSLAGVLCEILDADGERASRDQLYALAAEHSSEDHHHRTVDPHRRRSEKLVYRVAEADMPTRFGAGRIIAYGVRYEEQEPIAIVLGDPSRHGGPAGAIALFLFHRRPAGLAALRLRRSVAVGPADDRRDEGGGILVYLPQEGRGIGLIEKIKAYHLQDQGMDTVEANLALGHQVDSRDYGVGIQILKDLGLSKVRLLTNNPKKTDAFIYGGFDLEVVDQVPIVGPIHEHNARYLATKRDKMGHKLP